MKTIKRGAVIWAIAGMLLFAWLVFAAGVNAGARDKAEEKIEQNLKLEHFYRVVAGETSGQESGPANKLARDLKDLEATALNSFVGDSNRYGGITEDLGFDPFNGVDCSECGPLDRQVVEDVEQIKAGNLAVVIVRIQSEEVLEDEMPGLPGLLWVLWIVSLPAAGAVIYVRRMRSEGARYRDFPEERKLLAQLHEAKNELPPGHREWLALDELADRLREQIDMRASYKKSKTQQMKLETLTQEANNALDAIAAGNETLD